MIPHPDPASPVKVLLINGPAHLHIRESQLTRSTLGCNRVSTWPMYYIVPQIIDGKLYKHFYSPGKQGKLFFFQFTIDAPQGFIDQSLLVKKFVDGMEAKFAGSR